jgi:hypothetical protein
MASREAEDGRSEMEPVQSRDEIMPEVKEANLSAWDVVYALNMAIACLMLQLLLLAGFLVLCVSAGPRIDPDAPIAILAGMLGVSAMAVQNALLQIWLKGAPSTAVMTTNITLS